MAKWSWQIDLVPDKLPEKAKKEWPDLRSWPTPADVSAFLTRTRRNPDVRMAVLSGLRHFSTADLANFYGWLAGYIGLLAILVTVSAENRLVQLGLVLVVAILGIWLFARLGTATTDVEQRTRSAIVWLRAIEDGIARETRGSWFLR